MNRSVNKGVELNPNKDMLPICKSVEQDFNKDGYFVSKLAELTGVAPEQILSYDLCIYNAEKPVLCGFDEDFLTSPRLDNITSAFAVLYGIVNCNRAHGVTAAVLFDNEEVGSGTKQGADSATLGLMLEKSPVLSVPPAANTSILSHPDSCFPVMLHTQSTPTMRSFPMLPAMP